MLNDQDPAPAVTPTMQKEFEREKHINYFKRVLQMLPQPYSSMDTHRMTLGMYAIGGLDLLGVLDESVSDQNRREWIEWIYSQQRIPSSISTGVNDLDDPNEALYGFGGGPFSGMPFQDRGAKDNHGCECGPHTTFNDTAHVTMTYTALVLLVVLGDDLSRVAREPILRSLRKLQLNSGCFIPCITDYEPDLRFLFCAAAVSYLLNDWSGFNRETATEFIRQCQTYEYGFSQSPRQEAHGGTTYCAIASLGLMGEEAMADQKTLRRAPEESLEDFEKRKARAGFVDKEASRKWCIQRQTTGFQGRVNKPTDTCYSFWIGGALAALGSFELVNEECNRGFLMETQSKRFGGFGKWVDHYPDVLHSYMGIAAMSLMGEPGLLPLDPLLNMSRRAKEHLYTQTVFWKDA